MTFRPNEIQKSLRQNYPFDGHAYSTGTIDACTTSVTIQFGFVPTLILLQQVSCGTLTGNYLTSLDASSFGNTTAVPSADDIIQVSTDNIGTSIRINRTAGSGTITIVAQS